MRLAMSPAVLCGVVVGSTSIVVVSVATSLDASLVVVVPLVVTVGVVVGVVVVVSVPATVSVSVGVVVSLVVSPAAGLEKRVWKMRLTAMMAASFLPVKATRVKHARICQRTQIRSHITRGFCRQHLVVNTPANLHLPREEFQNRTTRRLVWDTQADLAVETPGTA